MDYEHDATLHACGTCPRRYQDPELAAQCCKRNHA